MLWAKDSNGRPVTGPPTIGEWYTVPNLVYVNLGTRIPGLWGAFRDSSAIPAMHKKAKAKGAAYAALGYKVVEVDWTTTAHPIPVSDKVPEEMGHDWGSASPLAAQLADVDLAAWGYGGHGADPGILVYKHDTYQGKTGKWTLSSGKYVHHRLAEMWLYACYSLAANAGGPAQYTAESRRGRTKGFSLWELNVSSLGSLTGYVGGTGLFSSNAETRSGGLEYQFPMPASSDTGTTFEDDE